MDFHRTCRECGRDFRAFKNYVVCVDCRYRRQNIIDPTYFIAMNAVMDKMDKEKAVALDEKQLWEEYDKWFFGKGISDYGTKMFGFMAAKWVHSFYAERIADLESDVVRLHKDKMDLWEKAHGYSTAIDTKTADESDGSWAAFDKFVHAQMSNRDDLWPVWLDAWFAARTDAVEKETMALEEAARTGFFGLLTRAQIVEALEIRDANIADETHVASAPAVEKEASGGDDARNRVTLNRRDLWDYMRGAIYAALNDKIPEDCVVSWAWEEATNRTIDIFQKTVDAASPTVGDSAVIPKLKPPKYHLDENGEMVRGAGDSAGEPVAWMLEKPKESGGWFTSRRAAMELCVSQGAVATPLYAHPPAQTADVRSRALEEVAKRLDEYQQNIWQHNYWQCAANIVRSMKDSK
jgi:hypothetical protein